MAKTALTDDMLTMEPGLPPAFTASTMWRATAWPTRKEPFRLTREHAVEIGLGEVEEIGGVHDAGIVDQDVDVAEGGNRGFDEPCDVGTAC